MLTLKFEQATDPTARLQQLPQGFLTFSVTDQGGKFEVAVTITPSDTSTRYLALMQPSELTLKFSLPGYIEFPIGTSCDFQGERHILRTAQTVKKQGPRNFEYSLTMTGEAAGMEDFKFRDPASGRLKFSLCAKPSEFADYIVSNMAMRGVIWEKSPRCLEADEKTVTFSHNSVLEALNAVAEAFETEWELDGSTLYIGKVEHFKGDPLPLSYGRGNGFVPGVGRSSASDERPIKRLYVQGGERNIVPDKYAATLSPPLAEGEPKPQTLLLPRDKSISYDGQNFDVADLFGRNHPRTYHTDPQGLFIERTDINADATREESLDCPDIYPSRVSKVGNRTIKDELGNHLEPVIAVDAAQHLYDFIDDSIPGTLDFSQCLIEGGGKLTVVFQSGMLSGKEFEAVYYHEQRRFQLVPHDVDGTVMPCEGWLPREGDKYAVFNISLPKDYICNDETKTGASWDMFREAVRYLYENETQKFTFSGELQGLYAKAHWGEIGTRLLPGSYILFSDPHFCREPQPVRITGIKQYLSSPYSPIIELANSVSSQGMSAKIAEVSQNSVKIDQGETRYRQYARRSFQEAKATGEMLKRAMLEGFSEPLTPVTLNTMQLIAGSEALQFRFATFDGLHWAEAKNRITYHSETGKLVCDASGPVFLQHLTLGITDLTPAKNYNNCKVWEMHSNAFNLNESLYDGKGVYLYAKCEKAQPGYGWFMVTAEPQAMDEGDGYYYFLVGIATPPNADGQRSFATLYGLTEILPGRITTDRIISSDGKTYFNLADSEIGGNIKFLSEAGDYFTLINGGFIDTKRINTNELTAKRLTAQNAGYTVQILPENQSMEIMDGTETLAEYSGRAFNDPAQVFGSSVGSIPLISEAKINRALVRGDQPTGEVIRQSLSRDITGLLHTTTPVKVTVRATVNVSATNCSALKDSALAISALRVLTYDNPELTGTPSVHTLFYFRNFTDKNGTDGNPGSAEEQTASVQLSPGYHKLKAELSVEASGKGIASANCNIMVQPSYTSEFYVSRYFANGFCLGSSADNFAMAWRDAAGSMNLSIISSGIGFKVSPQGIQYKPNQNEQWKSLN